MDAEDGRMLEPIIFRAGFGRFTVKGLGFSCSSVLGSGLMVSISSAVGKPGCDWFRRS